MSTQREALTDKQTGWRIETDGRAETEKDREKIHIYCDTIRLTYNVD